VAHYAEWIGGIRKSLHALDCGSDDPEVRAFFRSHYRAHQPAVLNLPRWSATAWNVSYLEEKVGTGTLVEAQWSRSDNPRYEIESTSHKRMVSFGSFLHEMVNGRENDVYLTAQNGSANRTAFSGLWPDVDPMPPFLRPDSSEGFLWLGRDTMTPVHHDETNNIMCQVMGRKHIRLFPPEDRDLLSPTVGVHSDLGWVTDQVIYDRRLNAMDVWLYPGEALFLPIGWWHCVQAHGVALTLVYTSFIWPNFWGRVPD
jgi:hypothetical protein